MTVVWTSSNANLNAYSLQYILINPNLGHLSFNPPKMCGWLYMNELFACHTQYNLLDTNEQHGYHHERLCSTSQVQISQKKSVPVLAGCFPKPFTYKQTTTNHLLGGAGCYIFNTTHQRHIILNAFGQQVNSNS